MPRFHGGLEGGRNRTHPSGFEDHRSTTELHPLLFWAYRHTSFLTVLAGFFFEGVAFVFAVPPFLAPLCFLTPRLGFALVIYPKM